MSTREPGARTLDRRHFGRRHLFQVPGALVPEEDEHHEVVSAGPPLDQVVWFFPCRLAYHGWAPFAWNHVASIRAQVEAKLAEDGCTWYPSLADLDRWDLMQWGDPR